MFAKTLLDVQYHFISLHYMLITFIDKRRGAKTKKKSTSNVLFCIIISEQHHAKNRIFEAYESTDVPGH